MSVEAKVLWTARSAREEVGGVVAFLVQLMNADTVKARGEKPVPRAKVKGIERKSRLI